MSKNILTYISIILLIVVIGGFFIWALFAQSEPGVVPIKGNEPVIYTFLGLGIIGLVTTSISVKAHNEDGNKVSKKAVYGGLSLAILFFLWRVMVSL